MFLRASQTLVGKWGQRIFSLLGKNKTVKALEMNLLSAFVNSTYVGNGINSSKRTLHHIAFARSIVEWMLRERHVDFRMDRINFRMGNPLELPRGRLLNQNPTLNKLCTSVSTLFATRSIEQNGAEKKH